MRSFVDNHFGSSNRVLDLVEFVVVGYGEVVPQSSPSLHTEDLIQIQPPGKIPMEIPIPQRAYGKFSVVERPILL